MSCKLLHLILLQHMELHFCHLRDRKNRSSVAKKRFILFRQTRSYCHNRQDYHVIMNIILFDYIIIFEYKVKLKKVLRLFHLKHFE